MRKVCLVKDFLAKQIQKINVIQIIINEAIMPRFLKGEGVMSFIFFVLGLIFGSFFNVVIYRLPLDIPIHKGRSMCPSCNTVLKAKDLFPVLSFVFLGGKCRYCGGGISLRYPLIELATGVLYFLAYMMWGFGIETFLYISFWSMLLIVMMIDLDHLIVLDSVLIIFSLMNLLAIILLQYSWKHYVYGAFVGAVLYGLVYLLAYAVYRKEAFGTGDITLITAIGIVLGPKMTFATALMAFYVALIGVIFMKLSGKKIGKHEEIPFGPSICISAFLISIYGERIVSTVLSWMGYY